MNITIKLEPKLKGYVVSDYQLEQLDAEILASFLSDTLYNRVFAETHTVNASFPENTTVTFVQE